SYLYHAPPRPTSLVSVTAPSTTATYTLSLHDALPIFMAASVVDLPHPVDPATRTMPRGDSAICLICSRRPSSSKLGTCVLTKRRSEEHTSELQSRENLVCRLLLEKKNARTTTAPANCA